MQSYVQKQSAHIDTFPMELKFCRQFLKGIRPLFRGVQVVFSKKAFFRTTLLDSHLIACVATPFPMNRLLENTPQPKKFDFSRKNVISSEECDELVSSACVEASVSERTGDTSQSQRVYSTFEFLILARMDDMIINLIISWYKVILRMSEALFLIKNGLIHKTIMY